MDGAIKQIMGPREWGMLLVLAVLWGGTFFFVEVALRDLGPLTIVALRVGLAAVALHGLLLAIGRRMPTDPRALVAFLGMGLLNNVIPFSLIFWGQVQVTGGLAAILNATTPFFTVLVAQVMIADERATAPRLAGVVLGLVGAVVVIGPGALAGAGENVLPELACLAGALSYAFAGAFGRRFRRMRIGPLETATGQLTASSLMILPLALVVEQPWSLPLPTLATGAAVLGLALLSTALAYNLYFRILEAAGATNLLLVTFLIPITALLLGALVLGEAIAARHLVGMAVIGAGLALIDGRLIRLARGVLQRAGGASPGREAVLDWRRRAVAAE
ncbi:MAG: DMT family transporter [Alphaproteobacteria bacterium]|nr:DMT family transporter [Alphaproteobacteria bacterium]